LGKAVVEPVRGQVVLNDLNGDGRRGSDANRSIRPIVFDDRELAVLMDLHALSSRAERAPRACESVVVKVVFGHFFGPERVGSAEH